MVALIDNYPNGPLNKMNWDNIVQQVSPYLVKIETPSGSGTGFLCGYNEERTFCCIATALHVVADADEWQQPIKIHNHSFSSRAFLKESQRAIWSNYTNDSAVILFPVQELVFPEAVIPLRPIDAPLSIGVEVAWLGYPSIEAWTLCFFSGNISARRENRSAYLIDGVAINGVSGGPVIHRNATTNQIEFVGVVSAYQANRQRGDALPGLAIAQDVSHFHAVIGRIKTLDEAKKKQAEEEAKMKQEETLKQSQQGPTETPSAPATKT